MRQLPQTVDCPCGSQHRFADCCHPYITLATSAPTAVALMRSRYTAYVCLEKSYLLQTWHVDTRPHELALLPNPPLKWLNLTVLSTRQGEISDQRGTVEFIARYKLNGKAAKLHETSEFFCIEKQWYYHRALN